MADNIDSLQIEISANAQSAEKSLGKLADTLIRLQSSLKGISGGQFQNLSAGIRQLSDSMQRFSGAVKTADFTRIATGLNKLSAVNVQGVSDASRAINTLTANLSQIGTIAFDSQGIANIANAIAQLGRKTVTQAAVNIPILTTSLSGLVTGLNQIGSVQFDISSLSELTSSITKLGGKSATTAASGNITKLATALKQMMMTLSTAPRVSQNLIQMTQALAQFAASGSRAGTATNSLVRNFNLLPASTAKARSGFNGLAGAIGKFYATYWLLIRGMGQFKKAIDISSDLTEVQNVVDVAFGDMSDKMNEFADSALELYGMSELTAKQIGSRFQAMGVSMGFAQKDMTDMSIRLTQLAGDLASFYNITQDEAATKLQSIFTGESEPLRSLGIDLAQTSVEAWALSQGIDADMRSMTNAEKTMLRYQFVLASTGQATNDFIRTQNSWANQLRLLTGAFEQLGSIVGGVLINAFKPFIQALNSVMGAVINFAQVVSDALGAIFGWEYQTGGGVAQDLELGAGAAEDIEDATGGAADNAKKLNKYIAAWHEVNNMTSNEGSKGSGGGGGAGGSGGAGAADGGQWVQAESLWERYTSSIDSLYALGDYIGNVLTDAMNSIDWDSVYESARNFGAGLASFLNGLISPELFGAIGTTIAGSLNTVLHGLDSFGQTFNWINFGESIAAGINNFFSTFDFGLLANTINVWAHGILDYLITAIDNIQWEMIGTEIGNFLVEIDFTGIGSKVGELLWKAINAGVSLWKSSFDAAPIETTLVTAIGILKFSGLGKVITNSLVKSITGSISAKAIGGAIAKAFSATAIGTAIAKAFSANTIVATISATMAETGASLSSVLLTTIWTPIQTFLTSTLPGLITGGITALAGTIGISVAGAGALVVAAVAAAIASIVAVVTNWDEIKVFFTETIPGWWNGTVLPFFQSIPDGLTGIWETVKSTAIEKWNQLLNFMSSIPETIGGIVENISNWFSELPYNIGYALGLALSSIINWGTDIYDFLSHKIPEIVSSVVQWFAELPGNAYSAISGFISDIATWGANSLVAFQTNVSNIVQNVVNGFSELPQKAYDAIIKIKDSISKWGTQTIGFFETEVPKIVDSVIGFFADLPNKIVTVGEDLVKGLWNGINNMIDWLGTNITGFINGVIDGFKEGFDEHSPSKVAFEIGDYFTLGLANGISDRFGDVYKMVDNFTGDISSFRMSMPVVDLSVDTSKYQFNPMSVNTGKLQSEMQQSLDYMFGASGGIIDYNRLGEAVYQAQSQAMQENPVQIGDDDVFRSAQRAQTRYQKRTNRIGWAGI